MQIRVRHFQFTADAVETHLTVCLLERERMRGRHFLSVYQPLVHAPEVRMLQRHAEIIHEPRDERELLGRTDGAAKADGIVRRGLPPRADVFERLGEIKFLQRVVEHDAEARAREFQHRLRGEPCGVGDEIVFERGVIPPVGRDGTELAWHGRRKTRLPSDCKWKPVMRGSRTRRLSSASWLFHEHETGKSRNLPAGKPALRGFEIGRRLRLPG